MVTGNGDADGMHVCPLYADPLGLVQSDAVATPLVQLRGARRRMVGHRRGVFQGAAALQVRGDASGTERVVADLRAAPNRAESGLSGGSDAGAIEVRV